ncbi:MULTISPECIES: hypothetical protein [Rhodomicrobium]|uniref:hypothetical protein n=1 Tax=Rhodomicrobium TaxID=1068 RepID=UPI000F745646|nr:MULTISPECIES: hypothetical protein [Rhodomicrobium]
MLRELLLSVASGVIVALIMQVFGGGSRRDTGMRQTMSNVNYSQPRRQRSFGGGLARFVLAIGGGLALAYSVAPFILPRRFRDFDGGYDRFDDFNGFHAITANAPMLILTILGTIVIWLLLSALMRR